MEQIIKSNNGKVTTIAIPKNKKNHYLTNKVFNPEHEKSLLEGKPTNQLIKYFELLAKNLSKKLYNLDNQTKNACINTAIEQAWIKWDKFDKNKFDKPNPFAFFTSVIYNDMLEHLNYLKRHKKSQVSIDAIFDSPNFKK